MTSPENILAIGTTSGIKLYNTNTHSFISTLPFTGLFTAMVFSSDCARLAGGNHYGYVYLWDMRGIDASGSQSQGATAVTAMTLSRDCSQLACGFEDGTVELWETNPTKRRIASHQRDMASTVESVEFEPDGKLFASGSYDGTIKLSNGGDGSLHGTLHAPPELMVVALSNSVLIAAGIRDVTVLSLETLSLIHTLKEFDASTVSISEDSDLAAIAFRNNSVSLFDVVNRTMIATFTVPCKIYKLTFLPDKSQVVAQTDTGDFLSLNLINKRVTNGPRLEHLIQLPDTPLWHGVPVWHCQTNGQRYVAALFSQYQSPVPVLWIPSDIRVNTMTQGSSMITLGCTDGHIILLRLPSGHLG